jgi:starvation-inducible outer membrane lipoprotein
LAASAILAAADKTFTGTVTDSMCGKDHSAMKMGSDPKCTVACVKAGAKYAINDGKNTYTLSDQLAPEKFAGQRVTVTGTLNGTTVKVTKIEAAK